MCVTPAGKIGNCTWGMPKLLPLRAKKVAFFTLFYQSKTISSQFLFLPICRQEGIWSFESVSWNHRFPYVEPAGGKKPTQLGWEQDRLKNTAFTGSGGRCCGLCKLGRLPRSAGAKSSSAS